MNKNYGTYSIVFIIIGIITAILFSVEGVVLVKPATIKEIIIFEFQSGIGYVFVGSLIASLFSIYSLKNWHYQEIFSKIVTVISLIISLVFVILFISSFL